MPDSNFHEEKREAGLCTQKNESLGLVVQHLSSVQALFAVYSTRIFHRVKGNVFRSTRLVKNVQIFLILGLRLEYVPI